MGPAATNKAPLETVNWACPVPVVPTTTGWLAVCTSCVPDPSMVNEPETGLAPVFPMPREPASVTWAPLWIMTMLDGIVADEYSTPREPSVPEEAEAKTTLAEPALVQVSPARLIAAPGPAAVRLPLAREIDPALSCPPAATFTAAPLAMENSALLRFTWPPILNTVDEARVKALPATKLPPLLTWNEPPEIVVLPL